MKLYSESFTTVKTHVLCFTKLLQRKNEPFWFQSFEFEEDVNNGTHKAQPVMPPGHTLPFQGGTSESRHGVRASPDKNGRGRGGGIYVQKPPVSHLT